MPQVVDEPNVISEIPNYNPQVFRAPQRIQELWENVKHNLLRTYGDYKRTILLGCNFIMVILVLVLLAKIFSCETKYADVITSKEDKVICEPFSPTENVIVDIELNSTSHCYSSASCVGLAQTLRRQQGYFRYNFILGIYGFVYVERGYRCATQDSRPGLHIRLPVDSIYNGTDFMASHKAVSKFNELLREGLECGKVAHNYTLTATGCGDHDDWCTRAMQTYVMDVSSDREPIDHHKADYRDLTPQGGLYDPYSLDRVYNQHSKLVVCTKVDGK